MSHFRQESNITRRVRIAVTVFFWLTSAALLVAPLPFIFFASWIAIGVVGSLALWHARGWIPALVIGGCSPLTVFVLLGALHWFSEQPEYRGVGLPRLSNFNPDPVYRIADPGGGCVIRGSEVETAFAFNLGLKTMARVFGPPLRAYQGPYPSPEEAQSLLREGQRTPEELFFQGRVVVGDQTIDLGADTVKTLLRGLRYQAYLDAETGWPTSTEFEVRNVLLQGECLVMHLREDSDIVGKRDYVVLWEYPKMHPFAYYWMGEDTDPSAPPRPPLSE